MCHFYTISGEVYSEEMFISHVWKESPVSAFCKAVINFYVTGKFQDGGFCVSCLLGYVIRACFAS